MRRWGLQSTQSAQLARWEKKRMIEALLGSSRGRKRMQRARGSASGPSGARLPRDGGVIGRPKPPQHGALWGLSRGRLDGLGRTPSARCAVNPKIQWQTDDHALDACFMNSANMAQTFVTLDKARRAISAYIPRTISYCVKPPRSRRFCRRKTTAPIPPFQ